MRGARKKQRNTAQLNQMKPHYRVHTTTNLAQPQTRGIYPSSLFYPRPLPISSPLQILPARRRHPLPKHRTLNLHIDLIKRAHHRLDVIIVDFGEERFDGLLGLRTGRVGADRRRAARRRGCRAADRAAGCCRAGRLVEEEELGVGAGYETGDVGGEEFVDYF